MQQSHPELNNKVALITGASRGIGAATAAHLAQLGMRVALVARTLEPIEKQAASICSDGGKAIGLACDVSDFKSVEAVIKQTTQCWGQLDVVVNNAGVIEPIARLDESDPDAWGRAIDINLKGVYHLLRAALPVMREQRSGVVINLSSGAATASLQGWSAYCASKAAVKMLTEAAYKENAEFGVRVVGLSPGTVATDMMQTIRQSGVNRVSQLDWSVHIPPSWAARGIAFLCTDAARDFDGGDFSIKTEEGRRLAGLDLAELQPADQVAE